MSKGGAPERRNDAEMRQIIQDLELRSPGLQRAHRRCQMRRARRACVLTVFAALLAHEVLAHGLGLSAGEAAERVTAALLLKPAPAPLTTSFVREEHRKGYCKLWA